MFDYTKHTKYMLFSLSSTIFMVLIVFSVSLYFVFSGTVLFTQASYWIPTGIAVKEHRIKDRMEGVKSIIIISGSNSIFGIHTPTIERLTGCSVYNFSLERGAVPLCVYMYLANKYVQNGDIVIAPLEYAYYTEPNKLMPEVYANFSTWGQKYIHVLPQEWQRELSRRNIYTYWKRLPYLFREIPMKNISERFQKIIANKEITSAKIRDTLKTPSLNKYGERLEDSKPRAKNFGGRYLEKIPVSDYFKEEMLNFQKVLTEKGASVYVTFPVSEKQSNFDIERIEIQEKVNYYRAQLENSGINFFGSDIFYNLENKYFFDSIYHLNATGSILRSLLLAEDINTYVLGKESSYDLSSPEAQKIFFEEQEKEALRIIEMLRKE